MNCPFDGGPLQVVNRHGIEIDWCPECKGVWLERGELDKVIDRAARDTYRSDDRDRDRDRDRGWDRDRDRRDYRSDDDHYKRHKRKSFLSELFD